MHDYGFFWLGPSIGDWMHFSFCGSPADAKAMTAKAKADLEGDDMTPEQEADLKRAANLAQAIVDALGAATFDGAGKRVAAAVKDVEAGHVHGTGPAVASGTQPQPHNHGKTSKT
jgi:hypothetical protein